MLWCKVYINCNKRAAIHTLQDFALSSGILLCLQMDSLEKHEAERMLPIDSMRLNSSFSILTIHSFQKHIL